MTKKSTPSKKKTTTRSRGSTASKVGLDEFRAMSDKNRAKVNKQDRDLHSRVKNVRGSFREEQDAAAKKRDKRNNSEKAKATRARHKALLSGRIKP